MTRGYVIPVFRVDKPCEPVFDLILYGVGDEIYGGTIVRYALKRRGLNPDHFYASVFGVQPLPDRYT